MLDNDPLKVHSLEIFLTFLNLLLGSGSNKVTKTIVEETIVKPDGSKVTRRSETTSSGGDSGGGSGGASFGGFSVS